MKKPFKDTVLGKILSKLVGIDQRMKLIEAVTTIMGNFKTSPVTTGAGLVLILVSGVLYMWVPDSSEITYGLLGIGASLLGVQDFWKLQNK